MRVAVDFGEPTAAVANVTGLNGTDLTINSHEKKGKDEQAILYIQWKLRPNLLMMPNDTRFTQRRVKPMTFAGMRWLRLQDDLVQGWCGTK